MSRISLTSAAKAKLKAMVGKKTTKGCPDCGAVMVIRQNSYDQSFFLGCHRYPDCKKTLEIDEALYMEITGQPRFGGM